MENLDTHEEEPTINEDGFFQSDEICYCSGTKPSIKQVVVGRNMDQDQYCLHGPKGILPSLPIYQHLTEERVQEIKSTNMELKLLHVEDHFNKSSVAESSIQCSETINEYSESFTDTGTFTDLIQAKLDHSSNSLCTIGSKRRWTSFSDKIDYASKSYSHFPNNRKKYSDETPKSMFGKNVTTVYVTLFDDLCRHHTSGTQATASVNKCLQASQSTAGFNYSFNNNFMYNDANSSIVDTSHAQDNQMQYSDVYFFGRDNKSDKHRKETDKKGVGSSKHVKTETASHGTSHTTASIQTTKKFYATPAAVQAQPPSNTASIQCYAPSRVKSVSIRDKPCRPCPGVGGVTKGDVTATVSHIKIGPRELCPVHGKEPCQGPKCIIAASGQNADDQPAVKVSTVTNPRRGVFELVIRKLTGAPLARNELMLEWTPPTCRPPTCASPCATPCVLGPGCRPSKCKMIVCRPSPCRPTKCYKSPCRFPCGTCSRTSCGKPCGPCRPCRPCVPASYLCRPCPPSPRCRPCPPRPPCRPCPPTPCSRPCSPCPPSPCRLPPCRPAPCRPRCRPPPRCRPCPPLPRCRPCPPPRCRPCPPPRCRPCPPPPRCRPCPPLPRCRPCPPSPRCRPCPPSPRCRPCPPKPCEAPCADATCCNSPCKSSPCLQPCPVGYRKRRRIRCRTKIRPHRKLISPCLNRSKACPMVRCRSVPGPCGGCCGTSPCTPRKCCSVFPWRPKCPVYVCTTRRCSVSPCAPCPPFPCRIAPCPPSPCPPFPCRIAPCPPLPCPPAPCASSPCPPLPCQITPCPPVPCPPQKCCSASYYKIKNCCGQSCSNCCT